VSGRQACPERSREEAADAQNDNALREVGLLAGHDPGEPEAAYAQNDNALGLAPGKAALSC